MAKAYGNTGMPVDTPVLLEDGVMHREADFHGNAKFYTLPPEAKRRADKGDLGLSVIKDFESRPLSHSGKPFSTLRKR